MRSARRMDCFPCCEREQGKRFVFLAGNHDHHVVKREAEELIELEIATGKSPDELRDELRRTHFLRRCFERRLEGVEVDIRYPTYMFDDVLCTHGHHRDFHARRSGPAPGRLLARVLWSIAVGEEHTPTTADYGATISILTAMLYTIAQLPNGTHAQRRAFAAFQTLERTIRLGTAPVRALEHAGDWLTAHAGGHRRRRRDAVIARYQDARSQEDERRLQISAPAGAEITSYTLGRMVRPSDPSGLAVEAFEKVVENLGWAADTDKIVFAHTHQPLDGVTVSGGRARYWNTGSWIYEPDLSSQAAYIAYLRNAWPGSAILIDTDEPQPRLLRLREGLNPLRGMTTASADAPA